MSDEPPIRCVRTPQGLAPVSEFDADRLGQYAIGVEVDIVPVQERGLARNRFYWSAISCIHENLPTRRFVQRYFNAEALHNRIKVGVGHVRHFVVAGDKVTVAPGSTSFQAMPDEAEFKSFVQHALEFSASDLIPGLSLADLRREAMRRLRQRSYGTNP